MKILVVDDEIELCNLVEDYLVPKGHQVIKSTKPKEALEIIKTNPPELVLLDIRMPEMSGFEVLKAIKRIDQTIPVIMVTVLNDEGSGQKAMELGAKDYITKPLSFDYLEKAILMCEIERKSKMP